MKAIRQRVTVREDGHIEITDASLVAGTEAEVVVLLPEPAGDGAPRGLPQEPPSASDAWPRMETDTDGLAVPPPRDPSRPRSTLVDLIGLRPSGRTAEDIDREIRDFRGHEDPDEASS